MSIDDVAGSGTEAIGRQGGDMAKLDETISQFEETDFIPNLYETVQAANH